MRKSELLAALVAMAAVSAFGQDQGQDRSQDPPSRVARLNYMSGTVSFRPGTVDEWTAAAINYPLYDGDHLWAERDARTELHVGSTAVRMGPETALAILNLDDRMAQLSLTGGTLHIRLRSLDEGESFEVDTPNAAVTLLRAGEYRFFVDGDRNLTTVTVRGGDAEVIGGGRAFTLHARDSARFAGNDDDFSSQIEDAPFADGFEIWCQDRDQREERSQSVRHVSRETIGYEDLDDNGAWSEVPDYGWVWAPRVNAGWAPYRDGRWAWVEPWGWTWVDEAPWGFAPFHYGRWANLRGSWFWVPGAMVARPVYAPALVAFVGGPRGGLGISIGGGSGVAWFPLGPHEVYRPAYRSSDFYVRRVNVTHVNVTNFNVTNVRYVNHNTGSVTAVSREVFVGARPVRTAHIAVSGEVISQGRVFGSTADIAPERSSVMGRGQGTNARPPSRFDGRAVVVRTAPPPPPVSFGARRDALQANPGRPLDRGTTEALRRTERPRAPMFRQAQPSPQGGPPPAAARPGSQLYQPPVTRDAVPPRSDRVGQQAPEQPRREPRVQEQQTAPRPTERVRPQMTEQPRREPRVQEQQTAPRTMERVRPQVTDQPRREPRVEQQATPRPQAVERPRTEQRTEGNQERKTERGERKQEKQRESRKEDRKQ
ncbi:MAG: hypothetical protein NTW28_20255 [Candidatus Solibacter sp.]|nr:hypothetical protein [Candidatus Solibacter sp.]